MRHVLALLALFALGCADGPYCEGAQATCGELTDDDGDGVYSGALPVCGDAWRVRCLGTGWSSTNSPACDDGAIVCTVPGAAHCAPVTCDDTWHEGPAFEP